MTSQCSHSTDITWLPTISFSHLLHSSSPSTIPAALRSSPSSSFLVPDFDRHHPKNKPADDASRDARIFGNGKKTNRARNLLLIGECDGKNDQDTVIPFPRSCNSFDRNTTSSSTVLPQPLPSPEALLRPTGDRFLPSTQGIGPGPVIGVRGTEEHAGADEEVLPPFRMRSVFSSQETRRTAKQVETRSCGKVNQDQIGGYRGAQDELWVSVPDRHGQSSPFTSPTISPKKTGNGDFVPYHYVIPKGKQSWSAPEIPTGKLLAGVPPAFFDTSPRPSTAGRSPRRKPKSPIDALSPIHSKLSLETSTARCESNAPVSVHPLPLPPGATLPSPAPNFSQAMPKSDSSSMKCQWQKGKLIGRGTFGSVFVATDRETGALCAMKEVEIFPDEPKSAECMKQLGQEIKVLSQLKHPNIVQYYGSEIHVHPGSINKYVREHCGAITEAVVRNFTRHILSGLAYLHGNKTIHRDIKGANLLVDSAGFVKLADFGMAKHLTGHVVDLSLKGSPYWMAPELMQAMMQNDSSSDLAFAVDIWSLGCTIIEMFTGKPPWSEYEGAAAMFKVMKDSPPLPDTLSTEGKDFLRCCFKRNPAERATAAMLLEHRFLKNSQQSGAPSSRKPRNDGRRSLGGLLESKASQLSIPKVSSQHILTSIPFSIY